jgi:acyl-CoA reductase-like NAD-dependent aldehyde dehydrogenase
MSENIISLDPSNGEALGAVPRATQDQVRQIVKKAKKAALGWGKISLELSLGHGK